jgi:uncharacterized coiled-coil protein SlyX
MNNKLEIILQQKSGEKKNKKIEDITKKIQKIEKLNVDFELLKDKIKNIKLQVDHQSADVKLHFCHAKERYIILLMDKYAMKSLTKWQKDIIANMINEEYEILSDFNYSSPELEEAFSKYVNLQNDEMNSFEREFAKNAFADMMSDFGFDDEEDDFEFDFSKMNDPKYKQEFEEKIRQKQQEEQERQKQTQKEKQVAKTDIDFQKVYKKLAKITHPDLYKTDHEKKVKEEQMQRLTKSWEERNYYDLLMIWLEIDPENTIELEITETNQKNIIKQLNEKITTLEAEMYRVKFHYKDTSFYYQNFNAPNPKTIVKKIDDYIKTLVENSNDTTRHFNLFEKTANLKKHLTQVYNQQLKEEEDEIDFSDLLRIFGKDFD